MNTRRTTTGLSLALCLAWACSKAEPAESAPVSKPIPVQDTSFRLPSAERVVAIGDLHGDVAAARAALKLAGALGPDDHWSGGKLVVVQTGDQLDRADEEPEILDLLERLSSEASAVGGALHALNGNHEVMNVQGDFRYVTEDGFRDFAATPADGLHEREIRSLPPTQRGRAAAFLSGEVVAKRLAQRPVVLQIGSSVFVHGGLLERHLAYGLGRINREAQHWMQAPELKPAPAILTDERSPIWLRSQSDGVPDAATCQELSRVLEKLSAKRLVVGHTVQRDGINSACRGRVWRIDVGLSRAYGRNLPSVLEITGEQTRVLQGEPVSAVPKPSPSSLPAPHASGTQAAPAGSATAPPSRPPSVAPGVKPGAKSQPAPARPTPLQ